MAKDTPSEFAHQVEDRTPLDRYAEDGFAIFRDLIPDHETQLIRARATQLCAATDDADGMHRERDGAGRPVQVYDAHRFDRVFGSHARHPRLLEPVKQLLGQAVYIWHSKLNVKFPTWGGPWLWHQDYGYWHREGVEPRLTTVGILLDATHTYSGSLVFLRGSHRHGLLPHVLDETATARPQQTLDPATREKFPDEDIVEIVGRAGDVVIFHPNLVHASGQNLSSLARRLFLLVFNAADNRPTVDTARPDWVAARNPEVP